MMRIVAASLVTSALALAPPTQTTTKVVDRRAVGSGVVAAISALTGTTAWAAAGESPKFSFFGILGNAETFSEGAAYGIDQSAPTYSPYSPYSARDGSAVYNKFNSKEVDFQKKMFAESVKRVSGVDKYIEAKKWEDVRSELERQVYNMRGTMNYLAEGKPEAAKAAKDFYQAMEAVNLYSKQKDQATAKTSYATMMAALDTYKKLI